MKTAGIICEYNPIHSGHAQHIAETRLALGYDCAIVCVMSGSFVQRGDFAVFAKHARAESAVRCGADLVIELPLPYALSSAEKFAHSGVYILDKLGVCDYISFGSEAGNLDLLIEAAELIVTQEADDLIKEGLNKGRLSYAYARQKAADILLGTRAEVFRSPNNLLGIEYIKAINSLGSGIKPLTVLRSGGVHDGDSGLSASALRKKLYAGEEPWAYMPPEAAWIYVDEITAGRGPVSMKACESAMLSRLRAAGDFFTEIPDAAEGLDRRFMKYAPIEPSVKKILEAVKTKRYAMSRLRRMLMCACLGITAEDTALPVPYIRVLAMNRTGMKLLREVHKTSLLPVITKPAAAHKLSEPGRSLFSKEAAASDFYALAYPNEEQRRGDQEWRISPRIVN